MYTFAMYLMFANYKPAHDESILKSCVLYDRLFRYNLAECQLICLFQQPPRFVSYQATQGTGRMVTHETKAQTETVVHTERTFQG